MFVRRLKSAHQKPSDVIHCIDRGETVCGEIDEQDLRAVRNIQSVRNTANICPECLQKIEQ